VEDLINDWLTAFGLDRSLAAYAAQVVGQMSPDARADLIGDPAFQMMDYDPTPGLITHIPVAAPRAKSAARSVLLKRTLKHRPAPFVRWVIAHELAHAHLRNAGRWPGEDPEHAADALAALWGFPRP
jgi:hypothetical protein